MYLPTLQIARALNYYAANDLMQLDIGNNKDLCDRSKADLGAFSSFQLRAFNSLIQTRMYPCAPVVVTRTSLGTNYAGVMPLQLRKNLLFQQTSVAA